GNYSSVVSKDYTENRRRYNLLTVSLGRNVKCNVGEIRKNPRENLFPVQRCPVWLGTFDDCLYHMKVMIVQQPEVFKIRKPFVNILQLVAKMRRPPILRQHGVVPRWTRVDTPAQQTQ